MGTGGRDVEPRAPGGCFGSVSRRSFLQKGSLTAAAVGVVGSVPGLSGLLASSAPELPAAETGATQVEGDVGALSEPLVAHVTNLGTGDISLYQGEREVLIRDPALASRLFSAARP